MSRPFFGLGLAALTLTLAGGAANRAAAQVVAVKLDEGVKVRFLRAPAAYDDKGHFRKRTAEELKELKGPDPKLPGYTADLGDLKNGQTVVVRLGKVQPGKDGKAQLRPAGTLAGQVVGQERPQAKGKGKKASGQEDDGHTLLLRVSTRGGRLPLDDSLRATLIEIHNQD